MHPGLEVKGLSRMAMLLQNIQMPRADVLVNM